MHSVTPTKTHRVCSPKARRARNATVSTVKVEKWG